MGCFSAKNVSSPAASGRVGSGCRQRGRTVFVGSESADQVGISVVAGRDEMNGSKLPLDDYDMNGYYIDNIFRYYRFTINGGHGPRYFRPGYDC